MFGFGKKQAKLAFKDAQKIFIAKTPEDAKNMCGFIAGEWEPNDPQFIYNIKVVPKDIKVEVIQLLIENGLAQVKILEGEHVGLVGWVPSAFVN